jgi:PAS domain S-box-containing protein
MDHGALKQVAAFAEVFGNVSAVVFAKDGDGRYLFVNRAFEQLCRRPAGTIVGRRDTDIFPPDIAEAFSRNDACVMREACALEFDETAQIGAERHVYAALKFPAFDDAGHVCGVWGIANDITQRHRNEVALRDAALAVSGAGSDRVFQELTRYLATILGTDFALIGELLPGEPQRVRTIGMYGDGAYQENMEYLLSQTPCRTVVGQCFRCYAERVGAHFPTDNQLAALGLESYAGYPLCDGRGQPIGVIAVLSRRPLHDASTVESVMKIFAVRVEAEIERRRAEQALRVSEASYRAIFEASEDAIFVHDPDTGAILDANPKACSAYGYSYDEIRAVSVDALCSGDPPYTGEEARHLITAARRSGRPLQLEWHRRNKDGSLHWDELVLKMAQIAGQPRLLAVTREITARKEAEAHREQLEEQLRQAQKMEAIGHLAGGIAHDFNNLLTGILGYVVLAIEREQARPDPPLGRYLEQARMSCNRARDLIRQMLTFSRGQRGEPRPLRLAALVRESLALMRPSLPATVEIVTELDDAAPTVLADAVQIEQVLLNLCINARDAMDGLGTLRLTLRQVRAVDECCASCHQPVRGDFVELAVGDDGCGIAADVLPRMFEPFFSTKGVGHGSGMGLAVVHGIVHEQHGHVVVDTASARGARFRILLPPFASTAADPVTPAEPALPKTRLHGRVLLVDDEETVLGFMTELLRHWGIDVLACSGAPAAARHIESNPNAIDVLLTDYLMPGITGLELARLAHERRPDLPVLIYSGNTTTLSAEDLAAAGVAALLDKPIDPARLFAALAGYLRAG